MIYNIMSLIFETLTPLHTITTVISVDTVVHAFCLDLRWRECPSHSVFKLFRSIRLKIRNKELYHARATYQRQNKAVEKICCNTRKTINTTSHVAYFNSETLSRAHAKVAPLFLRKPLNYDATALAQYRKTSAASPKYRHTISAPQTLLSTKRNSLLA